MADVTRILQAIGRNDPRATDELLAVVYDELRQLAAAKLAHERPGQTLQATDLAHEAWLRLVGNAGEQCWDNRGHFFAAAAEAMRRILVERARRRLRAKHGGGRQRLELRDEDAPDHRSPDQLLAVNEALSRLEEHDRDAAEIVKLKYFGGHSIEDAAELLGMSRATAYRNWTYAKTWLKAEISKMS